MPDPGTLQGWLQLGFAAAIAIYLLTYITRGLNGKFRDLTEATKANTKAVSQLMDVLKENARLSGDLADQVQSLDENFASTLGSFFRDHPERLPRRRNT